MGYSATLKSLVAVKQFSDPNQGLVEYKALKELSGCFPSDDLYRIPAVVSFHGDGAILVTEWVEASTLREQILDWKSSQDSLERNISRAGVWLNRFHSIYGIRDGTANCEKRLEDLGQLFSSLPHSVSSSSLPGRAERFLNSMREQVEECSTAVLHGDFKPENILVSESKVTGIDISMKDRGPVMLDVAHFANHLDLLFFRLSPLRFAAKRKQLVQLFVDAYFTEGKVPYLSYSWFRIFNLLRLWGNGSLNRSRMHPKSLYESACINYILRQVISECRRL